MRRRNGRTRRLISLLRTFISANVRSIVTQVFILIVIVECGGLPPPLCYIPACRGGGEYAPRKSRTGRAPVRKSADRKRRVL